MRFLIEMNKETNLAEGAATQVRKEFADEGERKECGATGS
jgi:hypothetical protein